MKCELPVEQAATISLAFTRFNVPHCAETMTQAYFQLLEEGLINRAKLVGALYVMDVVAVCAGLLFP